MFFNELNSQKADDKDEGYDNIYKPLTGNNRYILFPGSLHDVVQYRDKSQEPSYEDDVVVDRPPLAS